MESQSIKAKSFWSMSLGASLYRKFVGRYFTTLYIFVTDILLGRKVSSVLDIACGGGDFLAYVRGRDQNIKIAGTDIAPGMVEHARKRLGESINIVEANSESQPFQDKSFDAITIMMAFHHFPKKQETLLEIKRILKPGGVLIIADPVAKSNFQTKFWNFLERAIRVKGYVGHYTELDLKKIADEVGFSVTVSFVPGMSKRYMVCRLTNIK